MSCSSQSHRSSTMPCKQTMCAGYNTAKQQTGNEPSRIIELIQPYLTSCFSTMPNDHSTVWIVLQYEQCSYHHIYTLASSTPFLISIDHRQTEERGRPWSWQLQTCPLYEHPLLLRWSKTSSRAHIKPSWGRPSTQSTTSTRTSRASCAVPPANASRPCHSSTVQQAASSRKADKLWKAGALSQPTQTSPNRPTSPGRSYPPNPTATLFPPRIPASPPSQSPTTHPPPSSPPAAPSPCTSPPIQHPKRNPHVPSATKPHAPPPPHPL